MSAFSWSYVYIVFFLFFFFKYPSRWQKLLGSARCGSTALSYRNCVITLDGGWWGYGIARASTRCMMKKKNIYIYIYIYIYKISLLIYRVFTKERTFQKVILKPSIYWHARCIFWSKVLFKLSVPLNVLLSIRTNRYFLCLNETKWILLLLFNIMSEHI